MFSSFVMNIIVYVVLVIVVVLAVLFGIRGLGLVCFELLLLLTMLFLRSICLVWGVGLLVIVLFSS